MDTNFPAAHSMDTLWFAVDAAGHVGIFDTGEDGHMPEAVSGARGLIEELWSRFYPQEMESWGSQELTTKLGLYYFEYDEDCRGFNTPVAPYRLTAAPELALHVDQLPPTLREQVSLFRVGGVNFASCELVQPLEQAPCVFWSDDELAYLASDDKTVHPIPGKEDRFADFCKQFREMYPEEAKSLIFERPEEKPK